MQDKYKDHNLKIPAKYYEMLCIPLRLLFAILFILNIIPEKHYIYAGLFYIFAAIGLMYKSTISSNSWKCYPRAITIYCLIFLFILVNTKRKIPNLNIIIGLMLIFNILSGMQSKYIMEKI